MRDEDQVSAVALVIESDVSSAVPVDAPISLDAAGVSDEQAVEGDGSLIGPGAADGLPLPEADSDGQPGDADVDAD